MNYSRGVGQLYSLLRNRQVTRKVKTLIYTTILRPVLLFGSESWTLTTKEKMEGWSGDGCGKEGMDAGSGGGTSTVRREGPVEKHRKRQGMTLHGGAW